MTTPMTVEKKLYSVAEAAKVLGTNTAFVYKLIKKGYLRVMKLGSLKIRVETLDEFILSSEGKDYSNLDEVTELDYQRDVG